MTRKKKITFLARLFHWIKVIICASFFTLILFLLLPVLQTISKPPVADVNLYSVDSANVPPPPPPPEPEVEEEPEPEQTPPELTEQVTPLALDQLELALNPSFGDGWFAGDFAVNLNNVVSQQQDVDALFAIDALDQKPRVIYQPAPRITAQMRKKAPGNVYVIFIVGKDGKVENPIVQKSSDPVFEKSAISAIKQWKFEPGKVNGKPVRFRMRVPLTFPKGK